VDANGGDVAYCGAEDTLKGRVLLTGYESGRVWKKRLTEPNDHNITRPDQSGLSLSEYRLWADCLHVPLPFMGIRQVEDINTIGRSEEMAAWDMGGNYNKPIPRRIIEEAGVPRDMFAVKKLGVSVRLSSPDVLRSARIRDDYYEWLREHTAVWLKSGRLPPQTVSALARPLQPAAGSLARGVRRAERRLKIGTDIGRRLKLFATRDYVYKFLFPWALRRAQSRYESGLNYRKTCPN
jgi:hypothetical protein